MPPFSVRLTARDWGYGELPPTRTTRPVSLYCRFNEVYGTRCVDRDIAPSRAATAIKEPQAVGPARPLCLKFRWWPASLAIQTPSATGASGWHVRSFVASRIAQTSQKAPRPKAYPAPNLPNSNNSGIEPTCQFRQDMRRLLRPHSQLLPLSSPEKLAAKHNAQRSVQQLVETRRDKTARNAHAGATV